MKKILCIVVLLGSTFAFSQEKTFEEAVKKISKRIERITRQQKDSLKQKVENINLRLEKKEITLEEASKLKKEAAIYHAANIEKWVSVQEQKLQQLVQDKANGKIKSIDAYEENTFSIGDTKFKLYVDNSKERKKYREKREQREKRKHSKKTTSQIVFAGGLNNVLTNNQLNSLNNSDYKFWQSHFYEVGFTLKTRLTRKASKAYFKYGISFLWNNLRATNNQYHLKVGNVTNLVMHPESLSESRLRHVQMTFPMHLEFDFSKNKIYKDGKTRDRTSESVRIGVGGFFGFKIGTRQYLEYTNAQKIKIEEIQKGDFNMNILNYGLSAYVGYKETSLYVKYDINPLFKNTQTRNISFGIRFDLD